jgi:hypothetical protein
MTPRARYSTPLLHVADIARSQQFYELLGFETVDTHRENGQLQWARMHCEGGALMFDRAEKPVQAQQQSIVLYMYTPDLAGLRQHLLSNGLGIRYVDTLIYRPPYRPGDEDCLVDPDGYVVLVGHWDEAEHADWLRRIEEKKKSGSL